jgi:MFS family permease
MARADDEAGPIRALISKWRIFPGLDPGLRVVIVLSFVVALGSYMVTPFVGVLLVKVVGLDIRAAGILVAVATFIQFGGSILGSPVAKRLGLKRTMVLGLLVRTCGLGLLGLAVRAPWVACPAVVLVAGGPALYLPANKAYVVTRVSDEMRPLFLAVSSAALQAGMALGPLFAAFLIADDPTALLVGLTVFFGLIAVAHQVSLGPAVVHRPETAAGAPDEWDAGSVDKAVKLSAGRLHGVLRPVLFNTLAYYLYFFFQSFIGLYAAEKSDLRAVGWVMLLNCAMVALLQPPLARRIARSDYRWLVVGSLILMMLGTGVMALGLTVSLLGGTALFTMGEIFLFLRCDLELVGRVRDNPTLAFGIGRLTAGIGGFGSGIVGGFVFTHYQNAGDVDAFWIVVAAQCAVAAVLALLFGGRQSASAIAEAAPPGQPATSGAPARLRVRAGVGFFSSDDGVIGVEYSDTAERTSAEKRSKKRLNI